MSNKDEVLQIEDLRVYFRVYEGLARVLDGVTLKVDQGERVGLVGETGCGKTVTAKVLMGMINSPPAILQGKVVLFGNNVLKMSARQLRKMKGTMISMVFQDPLSALNPLFTIGQQLFDVIKHGARNTNGQRGRLSKQTLTRKSVEILSQVRMPDPTRILKTYPFELSGGMRQRVLIAMSLVNKPRFLIADEPVTALDVTIQAQIMNLLKDLIQQFGVSLLLISHNLGVVRDIVERINIMYAGQVVENAPTKEFFASPLHPYSEGLLQCVPRLTGERFSRGIKGMVPDYTEPPPGCRFHPRCPHAKEKCRMTKPPVTSVSPGHHVACFLYGGEQNG